MTVGSMRHFLWQCMQTIIMLSFVWLFMSFIVEFMLKLPLICIWYLFENELNQSRQ